MNLRPMIFVGLAALALTACGRRQELAFPASGPLPATPVGAVAPPTPQQLTTPSPQARPERSDEPARTGDPRPADPFDLPPG